MEKLGTRHVCSVWRRGVVLRNAYGVSDPINLEVDERLCS